ncbi:hypothetical protein BASA81_000927 [Batrachochytrium salamandrivorans]|nr:hypothetical protein BASA81_000927 [Batrachochytrium salamandrivorans]
MVPKRHLLAQQQAQAAYARLRSGERSLRDLLEIDLEIQAWEPAYDSLAFLADETSPQHAELVRTEASSQASATFASQAEFLRAVQSALDLKVFLTSELQSVALTEFPHDRHGGGERPKEKTAKRRQADLEEEEQEWTKRN